MGKTLAQLNLRDDSLRRSRCNQHRQKERAVPTGREKRRGRPAHASVSDSARSEPSGARPVETNQRANETESNAPNAIPIAKARSVAIPVAKHRHVIPTVKPTIILDTGDLVALSERAWSALERSNQPAAFFQHAETLVRIEAASGDGQLIRPLDRDRLRYHLARVAQWRLPPRKGQRKGHSVAPPWDVVRDMLARPDPPVPALKGLIYGPFVTPTGELHLSPGYCAETELYYAARTALDFPLIPEKPTVDQIEAAKRVILEPLADFPFLGEADLTHAIALSLEPFTKELIDGPIPAHGIDKPVPGAGAGLLTDILLLPGLGRSPAKITEPGDEAEWRRLIFGKLRQGPPAIVIDNIQYPLRSAALASALTEQFIEDRPTRDSRVIRVPAWCTWVFTGNNLVLSSEIQRRTIMLRLDPRIERPELRTGFRHPHLRRWMARHRAEQVYARLILIQAWLAAGRPLGKITFGSFESWSEVLGGILQVAQIPGFLANWEHIRGRTDPVETAWSALMQVWWAHFETRAVGVSELWHLLSSAHQDLFIALDFGDGNDHSRKTRLGRRLWTNRDRICAGFRLTAAGSAQGAHLYELEKMKVDQ